MVVINCAPHSVTRDAAWIVKNEKQNLLTKLNRTQNFPFKLGKSIPLYISVKKFEKQSTIMYLLSHMKSQ